MKYLLALILSLVLIPLSTAQAEVGKAAQRVLDSGVIRCGYAILLLHWLKMQQQVRFMDQTLI